MCSALFFCLNVPRVWQLSEVDTSDRVFCDQSVLCDWKWDRLAALQLFRDYIPLTNQVWGPYRKLRSKFFPLRLMGKKRGSVTYMYSTDRENEVSTKISIISLLCVWQIREQFPFTRNGFKSLNQVESKMSQFEVVFKSLAHFSKQFRVKESFKLLFASQVEKIWW